MARKLSQRKAAQVVVRFVTDAINRTKDIPPDILRTLIEDFRRREHVRFVRHPLFGATGPEQGLSVGFAADGSIDPEHWKRPEAWRDRDMDIARYVFAMELGDLSESDPGAFVFDKAFAKAQASNRQGEPRSATITHDGLREQAVRKGYFQLPKGSRRKAEILDSIINETGIYRDHKATAKESRRRHLKRIIEGKNLDI
jgi:hypothetical protein